MLGRESWVAALPKGTPTKSLAQVRGLLKLPEQACDDGPAASLPVSAWDIPANLIRWAGCTPEVLRVLRSPSRGDEKMVVMALHTLGEAASAHVVAELRSGVPPNEAFIGICRAVQQALGHEVGSDRTVFLGAIDLFERSITHLSPLVSGPDLKIGLGRSFPTLLECTSLASATDVKIGVAFDKFVKVVAKHPKVGCESVTKMVINAVLRTERPIRSLVLLRTLLSDFGLRLCAHNVIVLQLLNALGVQLQRHTHDACVAASNDGVDSLRPQLVGVLATCYQFSRETVDGCISEVEAPLRKVLVDALQEAPESRYVVLGAAAAEIEAAEADGIRVGSASRSLSRSLSRSRITSEPSTPSLARTSSRQRLPRPDDENDSPPRRSGSRRSGRGDPPLPPGKGDSSVTSSRESKFCGVSAASPAGRHEASSKTMSSRPPAPMTWATAKRMAE